MPSVLEWPHGFVPVALQLSKQLQHFPAFLLVFLFAHQALVTKAFQPDEPLFDFVGKSRIAYSRGRGR